MSTRRPAEPPATTALRPIELTALVQASIAGDGAPDPEGSTVEMLALDDDTDPDPEPQTTEIIRLDESCRVVRPTLEMRPLARQRQPPAPAPVLARGSAPIQRPRVTQRSVEILRVEDIKPDGGNGGRRRKPTR